MGEGSFLDMTDEAELGVSRSLGRTLMQPSSYSASAALPSRQIAQVRC